MAGSGGKGQRHARAGKVVEVKKMFEARARERQAHGQTAPGRTLVEDFPQALDAGKARDQAAAALGISGRLIDHAEGVKEHGVPELAAAVAAGSVAVRPRARGLPHLVRSLRPGRSGAPSRARTAA